MSLPVVAVKKRRPPPAGGGFDLRSRVPSSVRASPRLVKAVKEKEAEAYDCAQHFQTLQCTVLTTQRIVVGPQTRPRPVLAVHTTAGCRFMAKVRNPCR